MARSVKHSVAVATGLGVARAAERIASTSLFLHRDLAHKALTLHEPVRTATRVSIWQTGIRARGWAGTHRIHHDKADKPGDPHSPLILGRLSVLFKNAVHYRKTEKSLTDDTLPDDLQPDRADKLVYDKKKAGLVGGIAVDAALNRAAGNSVLYTPITTLVGLGGYVIAGGLVNTIGHLGERPIRAMVGGPIIPHEDGTYGSDSKLVAAVTGGEGFQRYHHDHEDSISFMPKDTPPLERAFFDPIGSAALALTHTPLADVGPGRPGIGKNTQGLG